MIFALISISLILIIFCIDIGIFPLMPNNISEAWIAKEFIALSFAVGISFLTLRKHKLLFQNPYILISLLYIFIHPFLIPKLDFGNSVDNKIYQMSIYHPISQVMAYSLFLFSISSITLSRRFINNIISLLSYSAVLISIYCIIQYFNLDDRQHLNSNPNTILTSGKNIVGFMSHPNQCGIFLCSLLPFVWHRNRTMILLVSTVILMTQSLVAIAGLFMFLLFLIYKYVNKIIAISLMITILFVGSYVLYNNQNLGNGRLSVWMTAINMLISGPDGNSHIIFGYGFGSYKPLIVGLKNMSFVRMHCDPLQWLFETGIVGVGLLIFSLKWLIVRIYKNIITNERHIVFALSFSLLLLCSFGSFVFQVEPHRYMGVFLLGILHNLARRKKHEKDYCFNSNINT